MPRPRRSPTPSGSPAIPGLLLGVGVLALLAVALAFFWPRGEAPLGATPAAGAGGQIVAIPPLIDLGSVPFDVPAEARYELMNTGSRPVRLTGQPRVKTLEGC